MRALALGTAIALALPAAASAQTALSENVSPTNSTGAIEVGGIQPLLCGATFDQASADVNLIDATAQSVGITLQCNAEFRLTARSAYGSLRNQTQYDPGNPRTFVPYTIAWPANLLDDDGAAIAPAFSAPGTDWARSLSASSAPTRQVQRGEMSIRWQSATEVLAGSYVDTFYLDIVAN